MLLEIIYIQSDGKSYVTVIFMKIRVGSRTLRRDSRTFRGFWSSSALGAGAALAALLYTPTIGNISFSFSGSVVSKKYNTNQRAWEVPFPALWET